VAAAEETGDFALAFCRECKRDVLTYPDLESDTEEVRRCLHCDERVGAELKWVRGEDLAALGYEVRAAEEEAGGCGASCVRTACAPATPARDDVAQRADRPRSSRS
jgi:hypothetical protein